MPGAQERVLRQKIASTQNTKKITRAMELIAATRVVKAQQAANEARPYAEHITQVIGDLASGGAASSHPLLVQPESVDKVGVVVLSSDRGMAGAYNSTIIKAAQREIDAARAEGKPYVLITVGRKAESYFRFRNYNIAASFTGFTEKPSYEDARAIAAEVTKAFGTTADQVELAYTQFVSMGVQRPVVRRFLPLDTSEAQDSAAESAASGGASAQFEFEPSPAAVLESLLPRYVESRLFAALLDAAASELASRQRAMKSATDNAEELIIKYSRKMNQARQDSITTEIMEIIGGAEAMTAGGSEDDDVVADLHQDPFRHFVPGQLPEPGPHVHH